MLGVWVVSDFLAFVECAGCGEMFPVRKKKALNRAKWCSERCRKAQYSSPCVDCGAPTNGSDGRGPNAAKRCQKCSSTHTGQLQRDKWAPRRALVERLWREGWTSAQIEDELGTWHGPRGHFISSQRARGWDLPHRCSPEHIEAITAGFRRSWEARRAA